MHTITRRKIISRQKIVASQCMKLPKKNYPVWNIDNLKGYSIALIKKFGWNATGRIGE